MEKLSGAQAILLFELERRGLLTAVNDRTAESLLRLGLVERARGRFTDGWKITEAGEAALKARRAERVEGLGSKREPQ